MRSILLVDDEQAVCAEFKTFLERKRYSVRSCTNALDAIRSFRSRRPDLVLTDYKMPEVTGLDLLRELKAIAPDVPVVLMSGDADMRTAVEALHADAFDFLRKPIDSKELLRILDLALQRNEESWGEELPAAARRSEYGPLLHSLAGPGGNVSLVEFHGSLDERTGGRVDAALNRMLTEGVLKRRIVFALNGVDYINNRGLNFLVTLEERLRNSGHVLALAGLSEKVERYIATLGYKKYFRVSHSVDTAVAELQRAG